MNQMFESIEKLEIEKDVLEFMDEIESTYIQYLMAVKDLGDCGEEFLSAFQRCDFRSSLGLDNVTTISDAYSTENAENISVEEELKELVGRIGKTRNLNAKDINDLHTVLMYSNPNKIAEIGMHRTTPVTVGYFDNKEYNVIYNPPAPSEVPLLMEELLDFYNEEMTNDDFQRPFLKPAIIHAFTYLIQPYQDGNKRVGRMLQSLNTWNLTKERYNIKIKSPAMYLSGEYKVSRTGYFDKINNIQENNFNNESWNTWLNYNAILLYTVLPKLTEELEEIKRIEKWKNK